jgi:hypothetical protein
MEAKTDKDMTYEFDVQGEMDHQHNMHIGKTRCSALDQQTFYKPGKRTGNHPTQLARCAAIRPAAGAHGDCSATRCD